MRPLRFSRLADTERKLRKHRLSSQTQTRVCFQLNCHERELVSSTINRLKIRGLRVRLFSASLAYSSWSSSSTGGVTVASGATNFGYNANKCSTMALREGVDRIKPDERVLIDLIEGLIHWSWIGPAGALG